VKKLIITSFIYLPALAFGQLNEYGKALENGKANWQMVWFEVQQQLKVMSEY